MSIKSTLGLVVVLAAGPLAAGAAQSVGGRAFGVFVNTPVAAQAQSPLATLPAISGTDGDIAHADADGLSVPNALSSGLASSTATGAIGAAATSAQSVASVAEVNLLGGLITASEVIATVTSTRGASGAASNANGSTFENLVVAGVPVTSGDATVAPNTQRSLPGVGYVVLNEQIPTGDGVTSSGMTVNMIHLYLQSITGGFVDPVTGQVVGGTPTTTGEIIVGSATTSVGG